MRSLPNGLEVGYPFIQKGLVNPDPAAGIGGGNTLPDGFVQSDGLTVKVIGQCGTSNHLYLIILG